MNTTKVKFDRSKKAERLRLYHPFEDADRDNVPNLFDCQPFNPNEQGLREFLLNVPGAISSGVSTVKSKIGSLARVMSKPTSLSAIYLTSIQQRQPPAPVPSTPSEQTRQPPKKSGTPSIYSTVLAPSLTHYKIISDIAGKGEQMYGARIVEPVQLSILGERERQLREQSEKVQQAYEVSQSLEKPEWRTDEGIVLPIQVAPEVKAWQQKWENWDKKWSHYIKGRWFVGSEEQYKQYNKELQEYQKGFNKYYKKVGGRYVLRDKYLKYTPEAQKYAEAAETYEKELEKYKTLPKPSAPRQLVGGFIGGAVSIPGFITFSTPRILGEGLVAPTAVPGKTVSYVKSMHEFAKERPAQFIGSVASMIAVGEAGRLKPYVERLSPLYVSPKRIMRTSVLKENMPSTGRVSVSTSAKTLKDLMEETEFKLTSKPEEVWHATAGRFEMGKHGVTFVKEGYSATKGLYVGPEAYPKFAVSSIIEGSRRIKFKQGIPTLYSIITKGIKIPKTVKVSLSEIIAAKRKLGRRAVPGSDIKKFAQYKKYVETKAPKGFAYISPEATAKLPWRGFLEVESVIPRFSKLKETLSSRLFTRFTYVKVPKYKLTKTGRQIFREFEKKWVEKFKSAGENKELIKNLRSKYATEEAKLLKKLKKAGELKQKGYEHVKMDVRRLVSEDFEKEVKSKVKGFEYPTLRERFGKTEKIQGGFERGAIRWKTGRSHRYVPAFLLSNFFRYRTPDTRRAARRVISEIMPERRRIRSPTERGRERIPEYYRGRRERQYPERERGRERGYLYPERGRERVPEGERFGYRGIRGVPRITHMIAPRTPPRPVRSKRKRVRVRSYREPELGKFLRIAPVATPEQFLKGMTKHAPSTKKSKSIMKLIEGAI